MNTMNRLFWSILVWFGLVMMFLAGCSKNSTSPEPTESTTEVEGFWMGGFVFQQSGKGTGYLGSMAMVAPNGESYFVVFGEEIMDYMLAAHGTLSSKNGEIGGKLNIYDTTGTPVGNLTISQGETRETTENGIKIVYFTSQFTGSAWPLAGSGELTLTRMDSVYNLASSLSAIAGNWIMIEDDGSTFLNVNENGQFTGGNTGGCQFSGNIQIINSQKNLYRIATFTISNCGAPYDGNYQGLATLIEGGLLWVVVKQDGSLGFYMKFSR